MLVVHAFCVNYVICELAFIPLVVTQPLYDMIVGDNTKVHCNRRKVAAYVCQWFPHRH